MSGFPRLAVGSLGNRVESGPMLWALAGYLHGRGRQVRHFFSRACYCQRQGSLAATGVASRHFDTWLMSREQCRNHLAEAYASADFVLVEGQFETAGDEGGLDALCGWLDLPRVIVLDAAQAADCHIPPRPDAVDAVLVAGLSDDEQFVRVQTCLEGAWGVPVVGGLPRNDAVRQRLENLPLGAAVPHEVCETLARDFARFVQPACLELVAARPRLPSVVPQCDPWLHVGDERPTVAVAFDNAFCGYFPDNLELLERLGARVVDFSPLADEGVPDGADVVLVGCGRPDLYAEQLASNHCMKSSLREFARRGGRVYAEGGGLAYLGRSLELPDGSAHAMVHLVPLASRRRDEPTPPESIEFSVAGNNWLLPTGVPLRAYLGHGWDFELLEPVDVLCGTAMEPDLIRTGRVVGGRLQLHLASQPEILRRLFAPTRMRAEVAGAV